VSARHPKLNIVRRTAFNMVITHPPPGARPADQSHPPPP
jgi:hypothetical protein